MKVSSFFQELLRKGGIRLRLMLIIAGLVAGTALVLSAVVFPLQEASIRQKAFDVCEVSALSISSAAGEALLTDQSLLLEDIIRTIKNENVEGLKEISVIFKGRYFVHSQNDRRGKSVESDVIGRAQSVQSGVKRESLETEDGDAYEFMTPIRFQERVIGYTRIVYDEEAISGPIRRARLIAFLVALITLAVSFAAVYFISGSVARPILQVADASRRVGEGDLNVRLDIRSHDELGILADQFNHMVDELKEKLHMSKFVSGSTVKMIKASRGESEMKLGGSRQDSAFFFSDVRGFTAWSEKTTPENVVTVLNEYLDLQTQIIKRFGGDIDKYVGDEIMAVFTGDDKEDRCLQAAVAVIDELKRYNDERVARKETALNVGIGCHCGEVVVGNMGSHDRMDFTAIGDVVNLSARLCSAAEALQIVTTKHMLGLTKTPFRLRELEPIKVKGKEKPIEIVGIVGLEEKAPK
ncbi:adenylate/guanylate cyclase domain-containing protein [Leptonema illini]|uniref:Adenylate/guanylate cyclase with integral membrane sensor n=1 Tax=Leptonema illini DSM 21528 TaxID=929563 RepID=H2CCG8_9LEPT|nr:adenylate/guanylate cyclase domain-containing protein [Leptonema illini]EHQ07428.1 adenylate/guanylate cyclase with integral membrane sensor [Leptonema illini DSM 21528]